MMRAHDHALFGRLLDGAKTLVLTSHVNPDGDSIGSELGLGRSLLARDFEIRILNQDPTPEVFRFVEGDGIAVEPYVPEAHDAVLASADLVVLLDNSASDRLGRMESRLRERADRVLCIDHHPTLGTPWAWSILDEGACATAAIVYELITTAGFPLDKRIAEALYLGLATDTGFFRFNSTSPRAHDIAAALLRAGADPARSYQEVYERNSVAYTRFLGHALAGLRLDAGGAVASIRITRALVEECQGGGVDTSEMITSVLAIDGVRLAVLFRELPDGRIKVSLRSKRDLDVHQLAAEFGGGGHRNASGIVLAGDLEDVSDRIIGRASVLLAQSH